MSEVKHKKPDQTEELGAGLLAAGLPVLLAFSAVLAAIGLNELVSHVLPTADATKSVILLIGMAVGVDYLLFYLRREREERAGHDAHRALIRAAATSGQAVLVSGVTVLIAMAGMLFAGNKIFTSMGVGTMIVVFVALVGSLTVLPALLHKLGDRVEKGRIPLLGRHRRAGESRLWSAILRPVLRFPAAVVLAGALAAAAVPVLGMHTKLLSFTDLPHSLSIVRTKLPGDWNWYLPRWLEWLPRLSAEGEAGRTPPTRIGPTAAGGRA